jgi:hypothetical protein
MVVHSALPPLLEAVVADVRGATSRTGDGDVMTAPEAAATEGLALIAPVTTGRAARTTLPGTTGRSCA